MILNLRQMPPRESKRFSIMPFQTLSSKQSEVAEFGITRLDTAHCNANNTIKPYNHPS